MSMRVSVVFVEHAIKALDQAENITILSIVPFASFCLSFFCGTCLVAEAGHERESSSPLLSPLKDL